MKATENQLTSWCSVFEIPRESKKSGIFLWCVLCDVQFAPLLNIEQWLSVALFALLSKPVFSVLLRKLLTVFFSRIERSCKRWFSVMLFGSFFKTLNSAVWWFDQKEYWAALSFRFAFYYAIQSSSNFWVRKRNPNHGWTWK